MNKMQIQVRNFQRAMGQPIPTSPTRLSAERKNFRNALLMEEFTEYMKADNIVDEADALADMLYILFGTIDEHGLDMEPVFSIVNSANMSKLFPDGKPRFNEIGKVIKPPSFIRPEALIEAEVHRQMNK